MADKPKKLDRADRMIRETEREVQRARERVVKEAEQAARKAASGG